MNQRQRTLTSGTMVIGVLLGGVAWASEEPRPAGAALDLVATPSESTVIPYAPVCVELSLRNLGDRTVEVGTCPSGSPDGAIVVVEGASGQTRTSTYVFARRGPDVQEQSLAGGARVCGTELVLFARSPTGFVFAESGEYTIRFELERSTSERVVSNPVTVHVEGDPQTNLAFLKDLIEISADYYGVPGDPDANLGESLVHRLLWLIIAQDQPRRVAPDLDPSQENDAKLVGELERLLQAHEQSSYCPYVARFLGLVYWEEAERTLSEDVIKADPSQLRGLQAYSKARDYLFASQRPGVWRPEIGPSYEAVLCYLADEKARTTQRMDWLRASTDHPGLERAVREAERNIRKWDEKRTRSQNTQ